MSFTKYVKANNNKVEFIPVIDFCREEMINNQFVGALHHCFNNHQSFTLTPDDIWSVLLANISTHINQNSDKFRDKLVDFKGKKELVVIDDSLIKGNSDNNWINTFNQFNEQIKDNIKDFNLVDVLVPTYSTTQPIDTFCYNISLIDSFQSYFNYTVMTRCGIPEIIIEGVVEDWKLIKQNLSVICNLIELNEYYLKVEQIINKIIDSYTEPDIEFFDSIYKYHSMSGGGKITGWITDLFCYHVNRKDEVIYSIDKSEYSSSEFLNLVNSVPFVWDYYQVLYNMKIHAGIVGFSVVNESIKPLKSYYITYQ
jgi:hypothetical protein